MSDFDLDRRSLLKGSMVATSVAAIAPQVIAAPLSPTPQKPLSKIAFGSCAKQDKDQPIWEPINTWDADLFVFLGDNIYADTDDMAVMKAKYAKLAAKSGFQELRRKTPCIAIWDDHDYGRNDAGREYPMKKESKDLFMEFWNEPADSPRRTREGNHMAYIYGPVGQRVQIIMPDNRWWRSGLMGNTEIPKDRGPYLTNSDPEAVMIGWQQWQWLQEELKKPAEIRIFASSTQVLSDAPGWETWALFQAEQQRLFDLIRFTDTKGLFCISGDTHYCELSHRTDNVPYPMWDLTSSGLTETWPYLAPNKYRVGQGHTVQNFGTIEIDWSKSDPEITIGTKDVKGQPLISKSFLLSSLQAK